MTEAYRPTLAVHVVWHPDCTDASELARALLVALFDDPDDLSVHGLRITVRLWRPSPGPPAVPPFHEAERAVLVVLIDEEFLFADGWEEFLDRAVGALRPADAVIGVSVTGGALELDSSVAQWNFIRLHEVEPEIRQRVLINRVTHALCRLLSDDPERVTVFLSHAKRDGEPIAAAVRDFLGAGSGLRNFFDAQDLLEGSRWAEQIRREAASNVLLAIRTDAYAGREWCRTEIIEAKRAQSPVVLLDALEHVERRGFPYLGNAPSVRWRGERSRAAMEELLGVLLAETLRFRYFPRRVADVSRANSIPETARVLPAPPELLTVLPLRADGERRVVYPDPPVGTDELALVRELAPDLEPLTLASLMSLG